MDDIKWTRHARQRRHARRIPLHHVRAALDWGRSFRCSGAWTYRLDRRMVALARARDVRVEYAEGVHVVVSDSGRIITVWRNLSGRRVRR